MSNLSNEQRSDAGATSTLGALLGALGLTMVAFVIVGSLALTGNLSVQAGTTARGATTSPAQVPAAVAPAAPAGPVALAAAKATTVSTIARGANTVPPATGRTSPATVRIDLETTEVVAEADSGQTYAYWTFNNTVPGPMLRVRVGDTVELHLKNGAKSTWPHSIDLHSVNGPGGGATATQTSPGGETMVTWKALNPGLYVYHCASAPIPMHIVNGMYGMILVEPEAGFSPVDREFYVVQGELYTNGAFGVKGHHEFDAASMDAEEPDYVVFNGKVGSLTGANAMTAKVGERVRIYFGVGGFLPSSLHLIGEIFDRVYPEGAVGSTANANVQTTLVPAGGSTIVEFRVDVPGTYTLVDHSLARALNKGAAAQLVVEGPADPSIYSGPASGAGH